MRHVAGGSRRRRLRKIVAAEMLRLAGDQPEVAGRRAKGGDLTAWRLYLSVRSIRPRVMHRIDNADAQRGLTAAAPFEYLARVSVDWPAASGFAWH
jgi:hypothetical protein